MIEQVTPSAKSRGGRMHKGNARRSDLEPEIPPDFAATVGEPCLINGEKREEYYRLALQIVRATSPTNEIEWMYARDIIDLTWEIRRYRRVGAQLVLGGRKSAMANVLQDMYDEGTGVVTPASSHAGMKAAAAMAKSGAEGEKALVSMLQCYGLTLDVVTAEAVVGRSLSLERLERMILSAERRRSVALRELQWARGVFGKRVPNPIADIIDAEVIETYPPGTNKK
jgi:hypothetical protein